MVLNGQDLVYLCQCAISAAYKAGAIISDNTSKPLLVKNKKDELLTGCGQRVGDTLASQVVTEVDLKCQNAILENLKPTFDKFDLALLAEESPDNGSRHEKDFFWCIDPLDGTLAYTRSEPGYSVSIALVSRDGRPQLGAIYDPFHNVLYHAILNQGAFRNEMEWSIAPIPQTKKRPLNFVMENSFVEHQVYRQFEKLIENIADENYKGLQKHFYNGAAMNACRVIELAPAIFFKLPKPNDGGGCIWDYAASSCIYSELDLHVSDIFGNNLDLNNRETPFMNHKGVLYSTDKHLADILIGKFNELL